MAETRENSGILFRDKKKTSPNAPDFTGRATIGTTECPSCSHPLPAADYRIAGWIKRGQSGANFLSLAFSPKEEPPRTTATSDDDLEF